VKVQRPTKKTVVVLARLRCDGPTMKPTLKVLNRLLALTIGGDAQRSSVVSSVLLFVEMLVRSADTLVEVPP
jgi:hypothetical protein